MKETYPRFNPHGAECKGHGIYMLDIDYSEQQERDLLVKVLENYERN